MIKTIFCGVGALGSHTVVASRTLAIERTLIDGDRVESQDLSNQAFVRTAVGKPKASALAAQLTNFWQVPAHGEDVFLASHNCDTLLDDAQLLIDCVDNEAARLLISDHARRHRVPVLHVELDREGEGGTVLWNKAAHTGDDAESQSKLERTPSELSALCQVASAAAQAIRDYVERGDQRSAVIDGAGVHWRGVNSKSRSSLTHSTMDPSRLRF